MAVELACFVKVAPSGMTRKALPSWAGSRQKGSLLLNKSTGPRMYQRSLLISASLLGPLEEGHRVKFQQTIAKSKVKVLASARTLSRKSKDGSIGDNAFA
jgi:hypothetical protein